VVRRNAPLSETGRLRLARCVVDDGWAIAAGRGAVPGLAFHGGPLGGPLPPGWGGRDGGPVIAAACQPGPDAAADRAAGREAARQPAAGPGPDRVRPGPESLHRAPGAGPVRLPAAGPPGPGHRPGGAPVRAVRAGRAGACGHQETRHHPRRRRVAHGRARPGRAQRPGHHPSAAQLPRGDRLQLPAHRRRRPFPPGLQRDPR